MTRFSGQDIFPRYLVVGYAGNEYNALDVQMPHLMTLIITLTISVPLISKLKDGRWNISRNFVTVINPDNLDCKFQFAIDRGVLKLLKKNSAGRIELFGFFRKQNVPVTSV